MKSKKIFFVTTIPLAVSSFLLPHVKILSRSYEVRILVNPEGSGGSRLKISSDFVKSVPIERRINLIQDIKVLFVLYRYFVREKPAAVHSMLPKAGLLAMLASFLAFVPVRVHTFTGQVWATKAGPFRAFLRLVDRLIAAMATDVFVDSHSQRRFLIENKVLTERGSRVLGAGSICGVDPDKFHPSSIVRQSLRFAQHTREESIVFLYLGRVTREKGVFELIEAFTLLAVKSSQTVELWLVGPEEGLELASVLKSAPQTIVEKVKVFGYSETPQIFMQSADVLCLPSYREGFGTVVIEAAACGIPAIASNIYGLTDSVVDGVTGWLVPPKNARKLYECMRNICESPDDILTRGQAARNNSLKNFRQSTITAKLLEFYESVLW